MSLWCDEKYLRLLAPQLDRFASRGRRLFNCRCPFCGDSAANALKARGYFFPKQQSFLFKCHNCGLALPFAAVLQRLNRSLYDEYLLESFDRRVFAPTETVSPDLFKPSRPLRLTPQDGMYAVSDATLSGSLCDVRSFVEQRQLPASAQTRLYATVQGRTWLSTRVSPEKCGAIRDGVPYLVIPLCVASGEWYGAQFRTLDRKEYLTFRWAHEELNRTFGLDAWHPDERTYCVEGPLDALCVTNALAFCGSDLRSGLEQLAFAGILLTDYVLVWDNEPRNPQIVTHLSKAIAAGASVVIWPKGMPKDINDCVRDGYDIMTLLATHTYTGLRAQLEFRQWTTLNR